MSDIKKSSNYHGDEYHFAGAEVNFSRIVAGIGWPGDRPGGIVVLGASKIYEINHYFVLAEAISDNYGKLLAAGLSLQSEMETEDTYGRHVKGSEEYLSIADNKAFLNGKPYLRYADAPGIDDKIQLQIEMIRDHTRVHGKTLHLFHDSSLPSELLGLPDVTYQLKNTDYPLTAALGYALSALVEFDGFNTPYTPRPNAPF